jgi:transposase
MRRTELLQEIRKMRFEEAYESWNRGRLTQEEAASLLGVSERTFRRYLNRFEAEGESGLLDRRLEQGSNRSAPVDEVLALQEQYRSRYSGWNARHFHSGYQREGGRRSYSWVKTQLQSAGLMSQGKQKGAHRKKRERRPLPGLRIHQDGSRHEGLEGPWHDLIVTMDDATGEHYDLRLVEEEGTVSSFQGIQQVIETHGLPCAFYSDRGSYYGHTPEAGGKVDKTNPTQFGRAMKSLGIEMIVAYSPEARGRSERAFATHQGRLPKDLALLGITTVEAANRSLRETYLPRFNAEFAVAPREEGSAFVPWIGGDTLADILCEQYERTVSAENCVRFEGRVLQIPADRHRCHYVKAKVRVPRYLDGRLAIFHGPRKLADYDPEDKHKSSLTKAA